MSVKFKCPESRVKGRTREREIDSMCERSIYHYLDDRLPSSISLNQSTRTYCILEATFAEFVKTIYRRA